MFADWNNNLLRLLLIGVTADWSYGLLRLLLIGRRVDLRDC